MFLLGKSLRPEKHVIYALTQFYGVGLATSKRLCNSASVHRLCKVKELDETHISKLKPLIQEILDEGAKNRLLKLKIQSVASVHK